MMIGIISPKWDWQFISEINIYNWLLSKFILGEGSTLSTSQISWSYLRRPWNEFPPKNESVFFFFFLPLSPSQKSMSAFVRFNLAADDSKSLSVSGRAAVSGWHCFPSEQRVRPVWTPGDTWGSNVAGHVSAGPLISEGDSQTCSGCRQPRPFHRPHTLTGGVQGSWIEIKPQARLSLRTTGVKIFIYLSPEILLKETHWKHQNSKMYMEREAHTL